MDIKLDKKTATEGFIKINLNESDYQQKVDEKVKDYARKATVKGFRPGKVPNGIIRKMYGKSILVEEVNHILSHALSDYIKENDIKLIGEPIPEIEKTKNIDWDNQKDFDFEYYVGLVDDFKYDISSKLKVKKFKIKVDEKAIQSTISDIKRQYGKMSNPETSEEGDSLFGSLKLGEKENDTLIELKDIENKSRKQFVDVKKDDKISFDLRKAIKDDVVIARLFSSTIDEAKGLKGDAEFTVNNINRVTDAKLDQDLFDKTFGKDKVKSEKEFMGKISDTMKENYGRESDVLLDRDIRDTLVEKTSIAIPDDFLKRWIVFSNEGKITTADIEKEYDSYVNELKWSLISNRIMEDQKIKVENEEVVEEAKKQIINQMGGPAAAAQFQDSLDGITSNFLQAENGQNYTRIFNQVKAAKVVGVIKENISVSEKIVNLDEFKKAAEVH